MMCVNLSFYDPPFYLLATISCFLFLSVHLFDFIAPCSTIFVSVLSFNHVRDNFTSCDFGLIP